MRIAHFKSVKHFAKWLIKFLFSIFVQINRKLNKKIITFE